MFCSPHPLQVKVIAGLGTTIDVILRNGVLREGDTLVLTGTDGPFATTVRALLMPQPLRELRVKNAYVQHKAVLAAQGVKITSKGELEKTLAGTPVLVAKKPDEVEVLKVSAAGVAQQTSQLSLALICTGGGSRNYEDRIEFHQAAGEGSVCPGFNARLSGGSAGVPQTVKDSSK